MCKRGGVIGSGGYDWLNGWFNVFIPYLKHNIPNTHCVPYAKDIGYALEGLTNDNHYGYGPKRRTGVSGPDINEIPTGLVAAPVEWDYHCTKLELEFKSGFVGVEQREGGVVAPCLGWYIQHKPPA